jgi:hypothetical protein
VRRLPLAAAAALLGSAVALAPLAAAAAEPPRIVELKGPAAVARWARFEARGVVTPVPGNPFDPAEIDVQAVFVDPSGQARRAIGFWYQAYERAQVGDRERLTPVGAPHFRVRFSPDAEGAWRWWWEVRTPAGATRSKPRALEVRPSTRRGFLRRSPHDDRYLAFDDGTAYFAVGENLGWYDARGSFAYDHWLAQLSAQGANYARLWMPSWAMGIEWSDTGLGDYGARLDRAWQLDQVLATAERHRIQLMLSLQNHGAFSTTANSEWAGNPYNAANGGPLARPGDFFTDPTARALFKRRLRYVVARWGWSTALLAWELWNEAELVDRYQSPASVAWHREMADWLRALDPHDHLVTTSFAFSLVDLAVWRDAGLDFTQLHFYSTFERGGRPVTIAPNIADDVVGFTAARRAEVALPVLFAELGVDARGPAETRASDPEGIGVHDGLWAGVVSGGLGTAMTWWWDNLIDLEPDRYYPMFGSVARFVRGVAFDRAGFAPLDGEATSAARPLVVHGLVGPDRLLAWVKDYAHQWFRPDAPEIADGQLRLSGLAPGRWCGRWYDPWSGSWGQAVAADAGADPAELTIPSFRRDFALRLARCPAP